MAFDAEENERIVGRMRGEPLKRWSGFVLHARCSQCQDDRKLEVGRLSETKGGLTVQQVVDRLRCGACKSPPDRIQMKHHVAVWTLLGPLERM